MTKTIRIEIDDEDFDSLKDAFEIERRESLEFNTPPGNRQDFYRGLLRCAIEEFWVAHDSACVPAFIDGEVSHEH